MKQPRKKQPCIQWLAMTFLALGCGAGTVAADEEGFESIFDGKTLKNWDGDPKFWRVEDGAITGQTTADNPTKGNTFVIWRGGKVADFELKLQYRIVPNNDKGFANSGIQYRSFELDGGKWRVGGYQADFEAGTRYSGILYGEAFRGILADRGQITVIQKGGKPKVVGTVGKSDEIQKHIKKEDWNDYHIVARNNHFLHKINGVLTCESTDEDTVARSEGILALQLHAGLPMTVQFRNIRLKRLDSVAAKPATKKIVFMAGTRSHNYASHEHYAGCALLAKALEAALPNVKTVVHRDGWPQASDALEGADALVMYCDGGARHPVNSQLAQVDKYVAKGMGVACIHYAVEVPKEGTGERFLDWIGGYFEKHWSVNPHWTGKFADLPEHPITRGVQPFEINDEWYYHMRFRDGLSGVTPILSDLPSAATLKRPDGPHSGNPHVRKAVANKEEQHVAWAYERPDGGRGFGFTGGHVHWNWGDDNFRRLVLNAIVWVAQGDVPENGVGVNRLTLEDLEENQDYEQPQNFNRDAIRDKFKLAKAEVKEPTSPHASQAAVAQLDIHPQLQASLFASEPMMYNPTNIDIDHLGRVWVCEVINYRKFRNGDLAKRKEGDRILILEDTDGDGKADKKSIFYQGADIDSAHGICVLPTASGKGTRALVSAKDSVFYLIDEDGDLKSDRKELLFTGISGTEHDHGIHAFVFGPDGRLYFNFGNAGKQIRDKHGKPIVDRAGNEVNDTRHPYQEGMVFRCNLDGSEFETLGWNFRNNWEVAVDSFGTMWQSDNDDDGNKGTRINFVMEFGNYGYKDELTGAGWKEERANMHQEIPLRHWHLNDPGVMPNLLQTGAGSPTGICIYEGSLLPNPFRGKMIHCDAGPNVVRAYPVKVKGAGFEGKMISVLDGSERNQWFRPSDVCVAPDGSLLVADWYDPGVGGHRMQDVEHGRIFRVTPQGHAGTYDVPKAAFDTAENAVLALQSPNLATRYVAWTVLHEMGAGAEEPLLKLWGTKNNRMRARALWLLGQIPGRGPHYVDAAISEKNANLRIVGIRLARLLKLDLPAIIQEMAGDKSPQVRRELLVALATVKSPQATELWAELARHHNGKDRWYLEALGVAARGRWDACLDAWLNKVGEDWSTEAGRDIIWRSRGSKTPAYLAKIIKDPKTPAETHPRYFRAFDFLTGPEKDKALESLLDL